MSRHTSLLAIALITIPPAAAGCQHLPAAISAALDVLEKVEDAARILDFISSQVERYDPELEASDEYKEIMIECRGALSAIIRARREGGDIEAQRVAFKIAYTKLEKLVVQSDALPLGGQGASLPEPLLLVAPFD